MSNNKVVFVVRKSQDQYVRTHDIFGVVCISIITSINFIYITHATDITLIGTPNMGENPIARTLFPILLVSFFLYVVMDTFWVLIQPLAVLSSPRDLVFHHLATLLLLYIPYTDSQFQWHGAIAMAVEFQTLLLISRRLVTINSFLYHFLNIFFYISWIIFRLFLNPAILVFFFYEHKRYTSQIGTPWNMVLTGTLLFVIINILGFYWTIMMAMKMLKSKKS